MLNNRTKWAAKNPSGVDLKYCFNLVRVSQNFERP